MPERLPDLGLSGKVVALQPEGIRNTRYQIRERSEVRERTSESIRGRERRRDVLSFSLCVVNRDCVIVILNL